MRRRKEIFEPLEILAFIIIIFLSRTRRNSGIPSSIDRPDEEIYDMEHCYYYGLVSASANRVPVFASASASLALLHLALVALAWR